MLIAEKGNRMVRIADERKADYIAMGYTVKDSAGNVIDAPDDPKRENAALKQRLSETEGKLDEALKKLDEAEKIRHEAFENLKVSNETLETENSSLKAENAALKQRLSETEGKLKKVLAPKEDQKTVDNAADVPKKTAKTSEAKK